MTTTFESASIGDQVWDVHLGWGEISTTGFSEMYPIAVRFENYGSKAYTVEGLSFEDDIYQTLFWDEIDMKAPTKPLPKLNKDDCVEVWNANPLDPTITYKRHFSHFEDGNIFCFDDGGTSWTRTQTVSWNRWRKTE